MADEKIEEPEEEKQESTADAQDIFRNMSAIEPLRAEESEDEDIEEEEDEHGTLEERIDSGRKLTDLQIADRRLNPDLGYRHLNIIEMSRIFPDSYNPLVSIMVKDLIKDPKVSVAEAIAYVNTAASIAIDGEGRIDEITIVRGHIIQTEEEKNKGLQ